MPFDFLRRRRSDDSSAGAAAASAPGERGIGFDGLTEEWRIVGAIEGTGRLSDVLNRREPLTIRDVRWAPLDDPTALAPAPGLRTIDPYDLIVVLASEDSLPAVTEQERDAHRVHTISYDVALERPPFRVIGTVYLYPGSEPATLLQRATERFVPVVDASAMLGPTVLSEPGIEAILVNRFYLRGVEQVDKRTGERPERLPGAPLGGVSWQDRSR
jgi:hypothetical protein